MVGVAAVAESHPALRRAQPRDQGGGEQQQRVHAVQEPEERDAVAEQAERHLQDDEHEHDDRERDAARNLGEERDDQQHEREQRDDEHAVHAVDHEAHDLRERRRSLLGRRVDHSAFGEVEAEPGGRPRVGRRLQRDERADGERDDAVCEAHDSPRVLMR